MPVSIGPTIGIQGEKIFRSELKSILQEVKTLETGMKAMTEAFNKNDSALVRNSKTQAILRKQIEEQRTAVEKTKQMVEESVKAEEHAVTRRDAAKRKLEELQKAYPEVAKTAQVYTDVLGVESKLTKDAVAAEQAMSKEIKKTEKSLETAEAGIYKSQEVTARWREEQIKAEEALRKLEQELLKTPDYLGEFQRNTEGAQRHLEDLERSVTLADKSIQLTETTYNLWTSELKKNADQQDYLKRKLEAQKSVLQQTTQLRKQAGEVVYKEERSYYNLVKKLEDAKAEYGENSKQARLLTTAVEEQEKRVAEATKTYNDFVDKEKDAKIAIGETTQQLKEQKNAAMIVGDHISQVGDKIASFGDKLTQYVTTPLIGAATASVKFASDFQDGMAKVYTIADRSVVPIDEMADGLKRLSDSSGFSLDDLTEAAYQAVSASVKTEDAVDFLTDATKLARAGFTDTTTAVDILSTVMNSYGHEAYTAAEISDILLKTQNDGKTIVDQLAGSMGMIIPMAKNYNVSLEQIAAAYATMTKQGVKTEMATTYLRAMFTELEKGKSKVNGILDKLTGKTFAQLMGEGKNLSEVLKLLWDYVGGNAEAFQKMFGNVRSTQAVAALAANDFGILNDELIAMSDTTGLVDEALETLQTPGLQARKTLNRLKNASEEFGEDLLKDLLPVLEKVATIVENLTAAYRDADQPTRDLIKNTALLIAAIGPGVKVIGTVIKAVGSVITGFGAFSKLLTVGVIPGVTTLGGAISVLAPAVMAVGAALGGLWLYTEWSNKEFEAYIDNTYGMSDAEVALCERVEASTQAMRESREEREATSKEIVANYDSVKILCERYNKLVDEEGNVKEGAEGLAEVLLGEIAEALGLDIDQVKELRDEHGLLTDEINNTIEAKKQEAIIDAFRDDWVDAIKRQASAQKDVEEMQRQYNQAVDEGNALEAERSALEEENLRLLAETGEGLDGYNTKHEELDAAIEKNAETQERYNKDLQDAQNELNSASNFASNYELAMQAVQDGSANAAQAVDMLVSDFKHAGSATSTELWNQLNMYKQHYDDLAQEVADGGRDVNDEEYKAAKFLYEQAKSEWEEYALMASQASENASKEQANGVGKYKTQAQQNAAQQKQMTLNGYDDKGESGRIGGRESKDYANAVDDSRTTAHNNAIAMRDTVEAGLEGYTKAYNKGAHMGQGFADGIQSKLDEVGRKSSSLADHSAGILARELHERSPSKVTREIGRYFTEGFALGIGDADRLASQAATQLSGSAVDAMYQPTGWQARTVNAPISVNVTVNGNVEDYGELADVIADRINTQVLQKQGAF